MLSEFLPIDGSVVIIENEIDEAMPLIKCLSKIGVSVTYFSGKDSELPINPIQKIRIAFVDIQLFGPSDAHSYAQNIARILDRIIPTKNGPYILIIWSTTEVVNADEVEKQITASSFEKRPVGVIRLNKNNFFQTDSDSSLSEDLIEEVTEILDVSEMKMNEVSKLIKGKIDSKKKIAKPDAVNLISKAIELKLKANQAFALFTIWENLIKNSSGLVVSNFASLHKPDKHWEDNFKHSIYRMAHAQLGQTVDFVSEDELIRNSLMTLNQSFLDSVKQSIFQIKKLSSIIKIDRNTISLIETIGGEKFSIKWKANSGQYSLSIDDIKMPKGSPKEPKSLDALSGYGGSPEKNIIVGEVIKTYKSILPGINTNLLIDFSESLKLQPGNVYLKKGIHWKRRNQLLENYLNTNNIIFSTDKANLKNVLFIELEVTPLCDFVQNKWRKSRLLPGILIPEKYYTKECKDIVSGENYYNMIPIIKIGKYHYKPVFDFRFFKSIDIVKDENQLQKPLLRLKNDLLADIVSRLASHANRVGIVTMI